MKKKIKDLTLLELMNKNCSGKGFPEKCGNCPFLINDNYGCVLHDLKEYISLNKLESEVEVDESNKSL